MGAELWVAVKSPALGLRLLEANSAPAAPTGSTSPVQGVWASVAPLLG